MPFVGYNGKNQVSSLFAYIFGAQSYNETKNFVPSSLKIVNITGGGNIASYAFQNCRDIEVLDFKATCTFTDAGDYAFGSMESLTKLVLPATLKTVGFHVCQYSTSCKIYFRGTTEQWNKIYDRSYSAENPGFDSIYNYHLKQIKKYANYTD